FGCARGDFLLRESPGRRTDLVGHLAEGEVEGGGVGGHVSLSSTGSAGSGIRCRIARRQGQAHPWRYAVMIDFKEGPNVVPWPPLIYSGALLVGGVLDVFVPFVAVGHY